MPVPIRSPRLAPKIMITIGLAVALTACSSKSDDADAIAITASDTECEVATTALKAGDNTFIVTNAGKEVTEVYIYGPKDRVITERENIGPGTKATFEADLSAGSYEVACKPGQKGDGIRKTILVTP